MRRKIANLLTGASTVAFVVIAVVWGHSIGRWSYVRYLRPPHLLQISVRDGVVNAISISDIEASPQVLPISGWSMLSVRDSFASTQSIWRRIGFVRCTFYTNQAYDLMFVDGEPSDRVGHGWTGTIPLWPLCLATAILPAVRLIRWRIHRRRHLAGTCLGCGYDLRATPERCPECGRTAEMMKDE